MQKPFSLTEEEIKKFLDERYALTNVKKIYSLGSYSDCNYYIRIQTPNEIQEYDIVEEYVLKFPSQRQEPDQVYFQTAIMEYLNKNAQHFKVPQIIISVNSKKVEPLEAGDKIYFGRLIRFVMGKNMSDIQQASQIIRGQYDVSFLLWSFQYQFGKAIAELSILLNKVQNEAVQYKGRLIDAKKLINVNDIWNVANFLNIKPYLSKIYGKIDIQMYNLAMELVTIFQENYFIKNRLLKRSINHHDACAENIILSQVQGQYKSRNVRCILDFGDMVYSYSICELVTALANIHSLDGTAQSLLNRYSKVIAGYLQIKQLQNTEWQVLIFLVYVRLAQQYIIGYDRINSKQENTHLQSATNEAWQLSQILKSHKPNKQYEYLDIKSHIQMQTEVLKLKVQKLVSLSKQIQH